MTVVYVLGLLVCGSLNTITMKIAFTMTGINTDGEEQVFQKPWFITFIMFVAMTLSLFFDRTMFKKSSALQDSLIDNTGLPSEGQKAIKWSTKVQMVAIPAVFDIVATGLCSMGFLYIPASVWQLLRGAEMVFAALFAVTFLGRKLFVFHWLGVLLCTLGIISVGLASVWGSKSSETANSASSTETMLLGISLALGGQVVQAAQVIAEEWLLTDVDLPGLQIVGFEGFWGTLIMLVVAFPLLYYLPGVDRGHLEDEPDAFSMVASDKALLVMIMVYMFSCMTYNMSGIAVTGALSAVHRVMLEAFRTSIVWIFGLAVHYYYDPLSKFGEEWTDWSWLEVCGFIILMLGQAVFGEMIRIPGLKYPEPEPTAKVMASPGNLRVLSTPLPRKITN